MITEYRGARGRGRPRREATSHVAAAGLRLIRENGFEATTTAAIAAEAGIGRSTFFRYFGSKDEILWHCQAEQVLSLEAWLTAMSRAEDPFGAVADAAIDASRDVRADEAAAARDHQLIMIARPELNPVGDHWARRRVVAIQGYVARALDVDASDTVPITFALAIDAALRAAGIVFARSEGVELHELVAASVRPIHAGFAAQQTAVIRS